MQLINQMLSYCTTFSTAINRPLLQAVTVRVDRLQTHPGQPECYTHRGQGAWALAAMRAIDVAVRHRASVPTIADQDVRGSAGVQLYMSTHSC